MSDDRLGGIALIAGTGMLLVTMATHPTGQDIATRSQGTVLLNMLVHTLAMASMPVSLLGGIALWKRLDDRSRLALSALVFFGLAMVAGTSAATISGFVAPNIIQRMQSAAAGDAKYWDAVSHLSWWMNQAFARVLVLATWTAIWLWSVAMRRGQSLIPWVANYGLVLAPLVLLVVGSGHIQLDVHGFGAVVLLQSVWFVAAGVGLYRLPAVETPAS
jgi:hypothetical protein